MRQGLAAIASVFALGCLTACASIPKLLGPKLAGPKLGAVATYPSADETARAILAEVASGADVAHDPRVGPQFADGKAAEHLRAVRKLIPKATPTHVEAAGWRMKGQSDDGATAELTYSWAYPHQKLLMRAVLHREHNEQRWTVTGVEARRAGKKRVLAAVGQVS